MSHVVFQFGDFTIDPAARELWQAAQRIALPPKSFECLAYLLEHRQRAVGRDELISAVWGRIDVSDAVLAQTLLRARRAVGDTGAEQTTIRTVPRFGYRWIAAVQPVDAAGPAEVRPAPVDAGTVPTNGDAAAPGPAAQPEMGASPAAANQSPSMEPAIPTAVSAPAAAPVRPRPSGVWLLAAAAVAAIAAGLFALLPRGVHEEVPGAGIAVAVMPVTVGGAEPESSWIRLGGMDYVAAQLREGGKLAVLPSDQIVTLVGARSGEEALQRVAKATAAKWLIEPHAEHTAKGWQLQLIAHGNGVTREATATAATPLEAAEQASDHLLSALDIPHSGHKSGGAASNALTELVQRVDASLLAGDLKEARGLIDAAPPEQRADPALRVREGQLEFRTGHLDEAERLFAPIAASATPLPVEVQSQAMMGLGAVAVRRQDYPLAEKRYAEALAALGDHGDPLLVGNAYNGRGVARSAQHQFDLAFADLGRARVALERAGNQLDAAAAGLNIGITENTRHRFAQAIPHFDDAIAVHERFGVKDDLAADLLGKAHSQLELLDIDGALASSTRAYQIGAGLENNFLVGSIDLTYARALLTVGRLREADAVLAKLPAGSDLASEEGSATLIGADVALQAGDSRKALDALREPVTKAPEEHLGWLPTFVSAALLEKQGDLAREILKRIRQEPAEADDRLNLELARARLAAGLDDVANAEKHYVAAVALADQDGVPAERARVGSDYARFLIAQHQLDKASAVVGDLAPYADKDYAVAEVTIALYHALGDTSLESAARNRAKSIAGERVL
jgi:DNA-binding winged helix-turn-helix (wHTH) protein/tetratricopeptide (TPR) repeat protein